jgi:acyl-CoA reductase-like NAD-dependent aldehyde dehydrogenase
MTVMTDETFGPVAPVRTAANWEEAIDAAKRSGLGFGYGPELLDELTRTKVVHYRPAPGRPAPAAATRGGR